MSVRRHRGFTLIEVLVAFAILALALPALFAAFETALSRAHRDQRLLEATEIARSLIARVGTEYPISVDVQRGVLMDYSFEVTLASLSGAPTSALTRRSGAVVTAQVSWRESSRVHSITLSTIKLPGADGT